MSEREDKLALRALLRERRKTLCSAEAAERICAQFFASPFSAAERFFVYLSVGSEADTHEIIRGLLARGKTVCMPRIEGREMLSVRYGGEALPAGKYGIPAPITGAEETCEVALVPLLGYDGAGNRLGYGGGYYDRYLLCHPDVFRLGLAYAGQRVADIPHGAGDVPLDALVCESGVLFFRERL